MRCEYTDHLWRERVEPIGRSCLAGEGFTDPFHFRKYGSASTKLHSESRTPSNSHDPSHKRKEPFLFIFFRAWRPRVIGKSEMGQIFFAKILGKGASREASIARYEWEGLCQWKASATNGFARFHASQTCDRRNPIEFTPPTSGRTASLFYPLCVASSRFFTNLVVSTESAHRRRAIPHNKQSAKLHPTIILSSSSFVHPNFWDKGPQYKEAPT